MDRKQNNGYQETVQEREVMDDKGDRGTSG
jgi:hypothetical protein